MFVSSKINNWLLSNITCKHITYILNSLVTYVDQILKICFRSIHSILNRSPERLLKEIILVDDASHRDTHRK